MPHSTAGKDARRYARWPREGLAGDMRSGMIPSLVCEGRPGFFQNSRLSEPPEIHRGHNVPFQLAERRG